MNDPSIIRNKLKINSTVANAARYIDVIEKFGSFSSYLWAYVDHKPIINCYNTLAEIPAKTSLSDLISKDLKKRGFNFVGSTIIYSFLQAAGLVNDHTTDCFRYTELTKKK